MNIYVGNLPFSLTEEELRGIFSEYGEVETANIIIDRETGRSKGFGFVEMPDQAGAESAIEALNDSSVNGRNIKVNQARSKGERPQRY